MPYTNLKDNKQFLPKRVYVGLGKDEYCKLTATKTSPQKTSRLEQSGLLREETQRILANEIKEHFKACISELLESPNVIDPNWLRLQFSFLYTHPYTDIRTDPASYLASLLLKEISENPEWILGERHFKSAENDQDRGVILKTVFATYISSMREVKFYPEENTPHYYHALFALQYQFGNICSKSQVSVRIKNFFDECMDSCFTIILGMGKEDLLEVDGIYSTALKLFDKVLLDSRYDNDSNRQGHHGYNELVTLLKKLNTAYPKPTTAEKIFMFDQMKKLVSEKNPEDWSKRIARTDFSDHFKNFLGINNNRPADYTPSLTKIVLDGCQDAITSCDDVVNNVVSAKFKKLNITSDEKDFDELTALKTLRH